MTLKTQTQNIKVRGQELIAQGNQRQVIFRKKSGESLFETNLTIVAGVTAFMVITGFVSIPLIVIGAVVAMLMGIRVEVDNRSV
ncbi:MAG: DUF4342 domain-containing protein [Phototrophicaceae bacterium]